MIFDLKRIIFILWLLSVFQNCFSLDVYGMLITQKNDTLYPLFHIEEKDFENYLVSNNLVSKLKYSDVSGKMKKISVKNVQYFSFKIKNQDYCFYAIDITKNDWDESSTNKAQFYRLLNNSNNELRVYEYFDISVIAGAAIFGFAVSNPIYRSYLVEQNKNFFIVSPADFKSTMKTILKENKMLCAKIKDGTYTFKDMLLIIAEYNNWLVTK